MPAAPARFVTTSLQNSDIQTQGINSAPSTAQRRARRQIGRSVTRLSVIRLLNNDDEPHDLGYSVTSCVPYCLLM